MYYNSKDLTFRNTSGSYNNYLITSNTFETTPLEPLQIEVVKTSKYNNLIGAVEYLIGCLGYSIVIMMGKYFNIHYGYIPILTQNIYKFIIIIIISMIVLKYQLNNKQILNNTIYSEYKFSIIWRCIVGFINFLSLTACSNYLKVTTSTTISCLSPLVTSVFAMFILYEKMSKTNFVSLILSIIGCLILSIPSSSIDNIEKDSTLGFLSGIIFLITRSGTVILQKSLSDKVNIQAIMLCISLFGLIVNLIMIIISNDRLLFGFEETVILIISGVIFYFAQWFIFRAITKSPVIYLQMFYPSIILFGFVLGIVCFDTKYQFLDYFGAGIVLFVNIYNSLEAYLDYSKSS